MFSSGSNAVRQWIGVILAPLGIMIAGTYLFLSPESTSEDPTSVFLLTILVALSAGVPFVWRMARGKGFATAAILVVYVGVGFVVLLYLPLVINCGVRAICE